MTTRVVTAEFEGGQKLANKLREMSLQLGRGEIDVNVGFLDGATYPEEDGGLPVAEVAFWNNYGTATAPARPFIENFVEDQKPTWARKLSVALRYTNYRSREALEILGADMAGHLRESIQLLYDPPLAPATIRNRTRGKRKVSKYIYKPLIDTGVMWRSVAWRVRTSASQ